MEIEHEVKTYKVVYQCDKCNKGEMRTTGATYLTDPPAIEHKCTHCGAKENFRAAYPMIYHKEETRR